MIIVFADLVGFTALSEVHGDELASNLVGDFYEIAGREADQNGLRVIKGIGDELLLVGADADAALRGSTRIVHRMSTVPLMPAVRVGMHAGPTIERDGDVFGRTVNLAARVVDQAGADEVVFTRSVLSNLVEQPVGISSLGLRRLRHIAKPVELFRLSLEPQAGAAMDPVCRMRVPSDSIQASLELADKHVVFCSDACKEAFLEDPHAFTGSQQACASS